MPATCGSDPIDLAPPFGGRHGTRLKMSPADFATSFTFSIALAVRLFCSGELAWSTAATLPVPVDLALSDLVLSDFGASESAAWAPCACAGRVDRGVSSTSAATAGTASDALQEKGRTKLINPGSSILLGRVKMRRVDHKFRQRPAEAIVDALRQLEAVRWR